MANVIKAAPQAPEKRLMRATWKGKVLAQSDDTVVVEGNHYFPEASLDRAFITFSNHKTSCAWKGQASYFSLLIDGELLPDAAWTYTDPKPEAEMVRGRVAFWKDVKVLPVDTTGSTAEP